jgi:heme exporter protein C
MIKIAFSIWHYFKTFLSLTYFNQKAPKWLPYLTTASVLFIGFGLIDGLFFAPLDYQQKDAFRIIYVHVPCAILSMVVYSFMALFSFQYLVWHIKICDLLAKHCATLGVMFTILALITGSIWGKPMWGTWWFWDARLTSEFILLFIYLGYLGLRSMITQRNISSKAGAIYALIGLVDIPIIHFSVNWWHTLHQGSTLLQFNAPNPSIHPQMLMPLLSMLMGFILYFITLLIMKVCTEIRLTHARI